ncbi:MAG TPA: discoidin domain-containing protein [Saprospiraceae bacterium]|nr:discoidin domain-containing protein [Saprospiraceae bacterium]
MKQWIGFVFLIAFFSQNSPAQTDKRIPVKGICIFIDYPDAPRKVSTLFVDSILNYTEYKSPLINRSFRKYWLQETRRNYDVQHDVFYYTAPQPSSYYKNLQWWEGINLWKDALEWVIANNPNYDWSKLSKWSSSDPFDLQYPDRFQGAIKSVIILSSVFGPAGLGAAHFPSWTLSNGETVGTIQGSILQAPWHPTINLFVLFHESGHSLFNLPDTYDYDASSGGTAKYSLMSAQGPDVEPIGAPFVYQHRWGFIKEPQAGTHTYTLPADGDTIVVVKNIHDPNEFFSLEVRKKTNPGNSLFPVPIGLLVWHTDLKVNTHNTLEQGTRYEHYKHSVVQKDGLRELENGGPEPKINSGDIFLPGDVFSDKTTPSAQWWAGENSGLEIKDIVIVDSNHVRFTVTISDKHAEHYEEIVKSKWKLISATPSQGGYEAQKAFDNDLSSYYHVPYGSKRPRPHQLIIDLGEEFEISEFYYTANDNFSPPWEGRIRDYELYLTVDTSSWGLPVASEQFFQTEYKQYQLINPKKARYVKFLALNSYLDDDRTSIAEIDFRGEKVISSTVEKPSTTDKNSSIQIYYNHKNYVLTLDRLNEGCRIAVYNSTGSLMLQLQPTETTIRLDLGNYSTGVYFVSVFDSENRELQSKKIGKMN